MNAVRKSSKRSHQKWLAKRKKAWRRAVAAQWLEWPNGNLILHDVFRKYRFANPKLDLFSAALELVEVAPWTPPFPGAFQKVRRIWTSYLPPRQSPPFPDACEKLRRFWTTLPQLQEKPEGEQAKSEGERVKTKEEQVMKSESDDWSDDNAATEGEELKTEGEQVKTKDERHDERHDDDRHEEQRPKVKTEDAQEEVLQQQQDAKLHRIWLWQCSSARPRASAAGFSQLDWTTSWLIMFQKTRRTMIPSSEASTLFFGLRASVLCARSFSRLAAYVLTLARACLLCARSSCSRLWYLWRFEFSQEKQNIVIHQHDQTADDHSQTTGEHSQTSQSC